MVRLTAANTNAAEHRLTGDTLVFECPECEWGEVVVTDMIEGPGGTCLDCGARFELFAEPAGRDGPADGSGRAGRPDPNDA